MKMNMNINTCIHIRISLYLYVFIFYLQTSNPFLDNNFRLKLCRFEGNLVEVVSLGT